MKIYYVSGVATSGKDTFINIVLEQIQASTISTVDEVKSVAADRFGWDGVKDERGRALLRGLCTLWGDYNDGPVNVIGDFIAEAERRDDFAVFVQVREYSEMMKMKERFGGKTINILRPGREPGEIEMNFLAMVPDYFKYDIQINNIGSLKQLEKVATIFAHREVFG